MSPLAQRLHQVQENIKRACDNARRDPAEITLVAISKTHTTETIQQAYDLGIRHFGEARWQEAQTKVHTLPADITWHFIGKLQSNKAKAVASQFHVVHTIESPNQIEQIDKQPRTVDALIQLNLAREPQKSGIFQEDLDTLVQAVLKSQSVRYRGLMTIGPPNLADEDARTLFRMLADLGKQHEAQWLSMGMSDDYVMAIQEGATHVRVGSAIFGQRT